MKCRFLSVLLLGLNLITGIAGYSQQASLNAIINEDGAIMIKVSDNGMWSAGYVSDAGQLINASIWNLETLQRTFLVGVGEVSSAYDITDDGNIVVGSYLNKPGYWENGIWNALPMPITDGIGEVKNVSPDGTQMVGRVFASNYSESHACHWVNGELVEVNHSNIDKAGYNAYFNEMTDISADGNTLLGCLNYTNLPNRTAFLMLDGEYFMFGSEYYNPLGGGNEYIFYDNPSLSPDGKWVTGDIYWVESDFSDEYYCPFRYDVENDITELFLNDIVVASFATDNEGNLFGAVPLNYPIREAMFLKNGEWVLFDDEVSQEYGIDIYEEIGYEKLGMIFSVSADGKTIIGSKEISTNCWVLKLDQSITGMSGGQTSALEMSASLMGNKLILAGKVESASIINMSGSKVLEQKTQRLPMIDVSQIPNGYYLVHMTSVTGEENTQKISILR